MAITITQKPTSPNAAYTRLVYVVSGSTNTSQPQYQYVMDVYESGSTSLIKRTKQTINPAGVAVFDPSRILQGELSEDQSWKISSLQAFNSSSKTFTVKFGEQYATSISSSVTVYPDLVENDIEVFRGVVDPNDGYYNWPSSSKAVLSNMPATMSMQSSDHGTIGVYNNSVQYVRQKTYNANNTLLSTINYSVTDNFTSIPISSSLNWNHVEIEVSSSLGKQNYRYEVSDKVHNEKVRFAFINKQGTWDYYNNFNPVRQNIDITRQQYTAPRVDYSSLTSTYDITRRGRTVNNSSTDDSFSVDTDWLTKTDANWLEELLESPSVYIQRNGEFIPIIINNSNYTSKTSAGRQKLFKYTFNFTPSNQPFGTWIPEYVECPQQPTTSSLDEGWRLFSSYNTTHTATRGEYLYILIGTNNQSRRYYGDTNTNVVFRINTGSGAMDNSYMSENTPPALGFVSSNSENELIVLDDEGTVLYNAASATTVVDNNGATVATLPSYGSGFKTGVVTDGYLYLGNDQGIHKFDTASYTLDTAFSQSFNAQGVPFADGSGKVITNIKLGDDGYLYAIGFIRKDFVPGTPPAGNYYPLLLQVSQSGDISTVTEWAGGAEDYGLDLFTSGSVQYAAVGGSIRNVYNHSNLRDLVCFNTSTMTLLPNWEPNISGSLPVQSGGSSTGIRVQRVHTDQDGKLLVTGRYGGIVRINQDGTNDSTYVANASGSWVLNGDHEFGYLPTYNNIENIGSDLVYIGVMPYFNINGIYEPIQGLVVVDTTGSFIAAETGSSEGLTPIYVNRNDGCSSVTTDVFYATNSTVSLGDRLYYASSSVASLWDNSSIGYSSSSLGVLPNNNLRDIVTGSVTTILSCP